MLVDEAKPFEIKPSVNVKHIELSGRVNLNSAGCDLLHDRDELRIVIHVERAQYT
jgi:hypothetical protein